MTVFGNYSRYYNLLYRDKDYKSEVEFVDGLIKKYAPDTKTILNLGCGTGSHDFPLAEKGYSVTGVDVSEEMLAVANARLNNRIKTQIEAKTETECSTSFSISTLSFVQGDIRTIRIQGQFDVVISLFHVMSYQTTNDDLKAAFATAGAHLKPGGFFIFDCWYGPAVLTDRPAVRVKRLEDEEIEVTRIAEPVMRPNENTVDVNYHVFIKDKKSGSYDEVNETHRMRYLFKPEIDMLLKVESLELIHCEEWMTGKQPDFGTWGVCFFARKSGE